MADGDIVITVFWWVTAGLFGLLLGSFATALAYRVPRDISMVRKVRSSCPHCTHALGALDLVPVFSWLFLRGRCRYCRMKISPRYPLIELATMLLCLAFYGVFGVTATTALLFLMAPVIVALIDIDLQYKIIPDSFNAAIFLTGAAVLLANAFESGNPPEFIVTQGGAALLGVLIYGVGSLALRQGTMLALKREPMGFGDIKFFGAAGFWLGTSIETLAYFMMLSGLSGVVLAVLWKRLTGEREFPFGPALVLAFVVLILWRGAPFIVI